MKMNKRHMFPKLTETMLGTGFQIQMRALRLVCRHTSLQVCTQPRRTCIPPNSQCICALRVQLAQGYRAPDRVHLTGQATSPKHRRCARCAGRTMQHTPPVPPMLGSRDWCHAQHCPSPAGLALPLRVCSVLPARARKDPVHTAAVRAPLHLACEHRRRPCYSHGKWPMLFSRARSPHTLGEGVSHLCAWIERSGGIRGNDGLETAVAFAWNTRRRRDLRHGLVRVLSVHVIISTLS